jgi:hypothetical protein
MKKTYILLIFITVLFAACTENFDDFNIDKKNPASVNGEALFTGAQLSLTDQISTPNVNLNDFRLFAQYWTETTYTDEANYDILNRTVADFTFNRYYVHALNTFRESARLIRESETVTTSEAVVKQNKLHIIELMNVYAFQRLVDIFGNIPYTDALDIDNVIPIYDDAFTIYQDLISRANAAIAGLDDSEGSFGSADLIFGGDVSAWIKFGNSLKVKLGITIADHDAALAKSTIESAINGIFESTADNALLQYQSSSPNSNPVYDELVLTGRKDFVGANTIIDLMNGLADPRLAAYYTQTDTSTETGVEKLAYVGGDYGYSSQYALYSHISDPILEPTFPGILLTYDEILFYLAEAAERGITVPHTAEEYYNDAIAASFDFWDEYCAEALTEAGVELDAEAYLAKPEVAYTTAQGDWKEKIGTQAYIALYTRGLEGWTEWRRLDHPAFNMPPTPVSDAIPTRFTYPINEQTLNPDNYKAAAIAVGGDELTTKLFWDKF